MHSARHHVVASTFGRRLREDRSFYLEKTALVEVPPCRLLQMMTQNDVLLQVGSAEVEIPMLESELLSRKFLSSSARDGNSGRFSGADDPEIGRPHFNITGLHLGVPHLAG